MRALPWFFAAAVALAPAVSSGNGRFPAAQYALAGPGSANTTIVLRATFGVLVSDDGGASFHYVCEEALGYGGGETYDPPLALDASGRLLVGMADGLVTASADRCGFARNAALEGMVVGDLDATGGGSVVLAGAASVTSGGVARVFRSDDGGNTFRALGDGVAGATVDTIEAAPSDSMRVYVTMRAGRPAHATFYRSDDGGATLAPLALPMPDEGGGAFIAAVDPTDANTVYVRLPLTPTFGADGGTLRSTVLLRTRDGGQNWAEIARSHGSMLGFAISDDGHTLWFGGPNADDRLQRSDDGGASWQKVNDTRVQCLRQHAGTLYVCGDFNADGFALGRSSDGGGSVEPVLRFGDVQGAFVCAADSPETACGERWGVLRQQYFASGNSGDAGVARDAGFDAGGGVTDAGGVGNDGGSAGGGGGGCSAEPHGASGRADAVMAAVAAALAVVAVGLSARWRRRRGPHPWG